MTSFRTATPRIIELSDQILADIKKRKLKPGDRYLTTAEVSRMLGVGNGLANRALQLLERRQTITRLQRRGAFIAQLPDGAPDAALRRIHFLVHQNYLATEGVGNDRELMGIQSQLPGVQVQISFLPKEEPQDFVGRLVEESLAAKSRDGFILVRAPFEVHKLIFETGVPAVVYGALYPGKYRLPRIDRDMDGVGRLSAEYLLTRGHRRFAFLSRQQCLPGDNVTLDAIHRALGGAGVLADAVVQRFLPADDAVAEAAAAELLARSDRTSGFICRNLRLAAAVAAVCKRKRIKLGTDVDVVLCDYYLSSSSKPTFVFPRPAFTGEQLGQAMAKLLVKVAQTGKYFEEIIPVAIDDSAVR